MTLPEKLREKVREITKGDPDWLLKQPIGDIREEYNPRTDPEYCHRENLRILSNW